MLVDYMQKSMQIKKPFHDNRPLPERFQEAKAQRLVYERSLGEAFDSDQFYTDLLQQLQGMLHEELKSQIQLMQASKKLFPVPGTNPLQIAIAEISVVLAQMERGEYPMNREGYCELVQNWTHLWQNYYEDVQHKLAFM